MNDENQKFAIIAESKNYERTLYLHDLTFARLIDDVVFPYETKEPFFIDGVAVKSEDLKKIKIVRQKESYEQMFFDLHSDLRASRSSGYKLPAAEYTVRLEALFREAGEDVTSQVVKAFNERILPRLKEYIPNRQELIQGASQVFIEAMKLLARAGI
jgi:hypothetical protein